MLNIPLNDIWLPILGLIAIVLGVSRLKKSEKKKFKAKVELVIGILVMLFSINNNLNQSTQNSATNDSLTVLHKQIISLQDTIRIGRDSLLKIGIEIDKKTGKLLIIDSQLLRQRISSTIIYNNYAPGNDLKTDKWFTDLGNKDVHKRELALDNILRNFPEKLNDEQLRQICKYISVSNIPPALVDLMADQPPSNYLTSIMKDTVLRRAPIETNAWRYLIEKAKINVSLAEEKISSVRPYAFSLQNLLAVALPTNNSKFCFDLLNSKKIVTLVLSQKEDEQTKGHFDVIKRLLHSDSKYEKYFKTYFFEAMGAALQ